MKNLAITTAFLAIGVLMLGQTGNFDIKSTQNTLVRINDGLFASKFEVTNKQYLDFLNFLKQNDQTDKLLIAQIDSAKWKEQSFYNEPYVTYYHAHPAYSAYPVVNISYEGATLFCEWLTNQYNLNDKRKFNKVMFRLPSEEEWVTAAKGGNLTAIYPWDGDDLQTKKGLIRCNFKRALEENMGVAGKLSDNADITASSKSYWPNAYGLYNMSGNVAEMIAEKGETMGGSWQDTAEAMKIESKGKFDRFDTPMPTVGFRYFVDVIEN